MEWLNGRATLSHLSTGCLLQQLGCWLAVSNHSLPSGYSLITPIKLSQTLFSISHSRPFSWIPSFSLFLFHRQLLFFSLTHLWHYLKAHRLLRYLILFSFLHLAPLLLTFPQLLHVLCCIPLSALPVAPWSSSYPFLESSLVFESGDQWTESEL